MSDILERRFGELVVQIDPETCIATQNCIHLADDVFAMGQERTVEFVPDAPAIERERLIEACRACPVDALTLLDADGTQLAP